jgi:hypothetical protein
MKASSESGLWAILISCTAVGDEAIAGCPRWCSLWLDDVTHPDGLRDAQEDKFDGKRTPREKLLESKPQV